MSTHNICFCREIRKIFTCYPLLSRPMLADVQAYFSLCWVHLSTGMFLLHYVSNMQPVSDFYSSHMLSCTFSCPV